MKLHCNYDKLVKINELKPHPKNRNHLGKDDALYDPFAGSGTSVIACEKTNRKCFTMELEPKYCDVIVKRCENYTEQKAELING